MVGWVEHRPGKKSWGSHSRFNAVIFVFCLKMPLPGILIVIFPLLGVLSRVLSVLHVGEPGQEITSFLRQGKDSESLNDAVQGQRHGRQLTWN